ncbi:FecR domain-containing protein [Xanthomonas citri]|uniref:FecR domain-containing protein n=1 Tax=Xanthomonas citri TaxID=346 RepID=UPI001E48C197|nr:FecR domain-containing protein [Xanthomonas citri]
MKVLIFGGTGLGGGYFLREPLGLSRQWHIAAADIRTKVGEQRRLTLPDGTVLRLNTASSVDVRFDSTLRRVILREGELEITTAPDVLGRRFLVEVPSARLMPVGTRFGVRLSDAGTLLTVQEGAVDLTRRMAPALRVYAESQIFFNDQGDGKPMPLDDSAVAWADGLIRADRMFLGNFLAELSRYWRGWIRCETSVAQFRLTALYTLVDTDPVNAILDTLPQVLPVSIRRVSPWLTLVGPAKR